MDAPRRLRPFSRESPLLSPSILAFLLLTALLAACDRDDNPASPRSDGDGGTPSGAGFAEILVDSVHLARPWGKALGDLDGDGNPDALVGLFEGAIYWYRHPGWEKSLLGGRFGGDDLQAADIDGDGALDVITNGKSLAWYRNPHGTGGDPDRPWELRMVQEGLKGHDLAVADFDRDGRADIAWRQENGPTTLFLQGAGGTGSGWRRVDLGRAEGGTGMAAADVNGDSRLDVVENGYWLEQPPSLDEAWPRHDFADWHRTSAVAVGDLNGDGRADIALSVGAEEGGISWFEAPANALEGNWVEHEVGQADLVHRIHLADMDRDGDLDILGADWRDDTRLKLWRNLSRNTVAAEAESIQAPEPPRTSGPGA